MRQPFALLAAVSLATLTLAGCGMEGDTSDETAEANSTAQADTDYGYETYGDDNLADSMASNDDAYNSVQRDGAPMSVDGENVGPNGDMAGATTPSSIPDSEERPIMQAQVVLDRIGFGPGVIDGKMGMSTENALLGFQEANDLETTGELDEATKQALSEWQRIPATRVVTIPASWSNATYYDIPDDVAEKAEMERLGYTSLDERLAERFHTTVEVLQQLNPNGRPAGASASASGTERPSEGRSNAGATATPSPTPSATASPRPSSSASAAGGTQMASNSDSIFQPGQQIRVPNIGADRIAPGAVEDRGWQQTLASLGVGSDQPEVDRIVVSKAGKTLKAYNGDELVALFTVSSGSSEFPLPLGEWDIVGEAYNPPYSYDPELIVGADKSDEKRQLPPGPNGPVGVVWIDLSKEHYGIHGTPDPETIGRAQSSGCVRLTNWDAARLAGMVNTDTEVIFEA